MENFTINFDKAFPSHDDPPLGVTINELVALVEKGDIELRPMVVRGALICTVADVASRGLGRKRQSEMGDD